ncbi:MAG: hypothetical protein V3V84_08355 [Candidatus Bathyarchaeia archaeon]
MPFIPLLLMLFSLSVSAQDTNTVWTYCAAEDEICYLPTTNNYIVRYGADIAYDGSTGAWVIQPHTNSVPCDNATFGDPLYLTIKECQYFEEIVIPPIPPVPPEPEAPPHAGSIDWRDCDVTNMNSYGIYECTAGKTIIAYDCTGDSLNGSLCELISPTVIIAGSNNAGSMKCCKVN